MANFRLDQFERIRIFGDWKSDLFIDVSSLTDQIAMGIELYPSMQYIEIRRKHGVFMLFVFREKSDKKHYNFGFWEDAKVIFSSNKVEIGSK